jgi:hypothetical protein
MKKGTHGIVLTINPKRYKNALGCTSITKDGIYEIWADSEQDKREMLDTLFHEFTYLVNHLMGFKKKLTKKQDEELCESVGYLVTLAYREGYYGRRKRS